MYVENWQKLQLFADGGGEGGDGAATGDNASVDAPVDAEQEYHRRLLEQGVPESKIRKRANKAKATIPEGAVQKPQQAAAAEEPQEPESKENKPKYVWDEVKADPDINAEIQKIIRARLKSSGEAEERLSKLAPALEVMARKYGLDVETMDYDQLVSAVENDNDFYEDVALAKGMPMEEAKAEDRRERTEARQRKEQERTLEQQAIAQHIKSLETQGKALKQLFPNFDLRTELQNPTFARLTSPNVGLSVEDAYYAVHRKEIRAAENQVTAQRTMEAVSQSIQAGQRRPTENGTGAPSVTTFDYRNTSKEQREELKRQIRAAAMRGEKIYPTR